ncbi:MAG: hypothetical protein ACE5IR_05430 [bacterium]
MKNYKITLLTGLMCLWFNVVFGGAIVLNFQGQPGYNRVTLKWTSQNEINLKGFEVERSFDNKDKKNFKQIAFIKPGSEQLDKKQYTYEDKSVFKSNARTFHYRLKIVDKDGRSSYSKVISVTPTVSSARQTWGSIKAMFR